MLFVAENGIMPYATRIFPGRDCILKVGLMSNAPLSRALMPTSGGPLMWIWKMFHQENSIIARI